MRLFAFPLREGSPEVNAWAIRLRVWRRRGLWKAIIAVVVVVALLALYHWLFSRITRGMVAIGGGLVGGLIGASLGGLGFILRARLFLDSAVTPLSMRDLVTAFHRTALLSLPVVALLLGGIAVVAARASHEQLARMTYRRYMVVYHLEDPRINVPRVRPSANRFPPPEVAAIALTQPWDPNWPEGRPPRLDGTVLSAHRRAIIFALVPLGLACFWFLLGLLALFALWEKTVSTAKTIVTVLLGCVGLSVAIGYLMFGLIEGWLVSSFPLGPPPEHFLSPADFWPQTIRLCGIALFFALVFWLLGNGAWRKAASLPLDRIHETMQARLAKRTKVNA